MKADLVIIGGGASGLAAAVSAARNGARNIVIAEKQPRVGKKLLATGNGRCNLYNENAVESRFFGDRSFAAPALNRFQPAQAEKFFRSLGIEIRKTEGGLYYPMSNQASAVLDCLRFTAKEAGVSELTDFECVRIEGRKNAFRVYSQSGETITARRVILASGGMASPKNGGTNAFQSLLKPFGHTFTACLPALTHFKTDAERISGLKGLKYQGDIALSEGGHEIALENGEILFGENGISGIAAMQLSVYAAERMSKGAKLSLKMKLLPMDAGEAAHFLKKRAGAMPVRPLEEFLTGVLQKRIGQLALKRAGVFPLSRACSTLTDAEIASCARELTEWSLPVTGMGGFDVCQVMLGGAKTEEFNAETMESRLAPGLYAAGELLNVTGPCGGYNLAWAWASGICAGRSAARDLC